MYIEDSFDTIFNMGYGGGALSPPWVLGREIRPWPRGLKPWSLYTIISHILYEIDTRYVYKDEFLVLIERTK